MNFIDDFVTPIKGYWEELNENSNPYSISQHISFSVENAKENDVVLLGFLDSRKNETEPLQMISLLDIRKELYKLHYLNWNFNIIDIGDIYPGETLKDSLIALELVLNELKIRKIKTIVFGGNNTISDIIYNILKQDKNLHFTQISPIMGLDMFNQKLTEENVLTKILSDVPCKVFEYTSVGSQNFMNPPLYMEMLNYLNFHSYRLGQVHESIFDLEPFIRTSDFANFDLNSIEFRGELFSNNPQPNGLYPLEICNITRFLGSSEFLKFIHFSNYINSKNQIVSTKMIAQAIWHFLDGNQVFIDIKENINQKTKYTLLLDNEELYFYKENISNRWWMECKIQDNTNNKVIIPCSEKDYTKALNGEIPDLYWKMFKKIL